MYAIRSYYGHVTLPGDLVYADLGKPLSHEEERAAVGVLQEARARGDARHDGLEVDVERDGLAGPDGLREGDRDDGLA